MQHVDDSVAAEAKRGANIEKDRAASRLIRLFLSETSQLASDPLYPVLAPNRKINSL